MSDVPDLELGYYLWLALTDDDEVDLGRRSIPIDDRSSITKSYLATHLEIGEHRGQCVAKCRSEFLYLVRSRGCSDWVADEAGLKAVAAAPISSAAVRTSPPWFKVETVSP